MFSFLFYNALNLNDKFEVKEGRIIVSHLQRTIRQINTYTIIRHFVNKIDQKSSFF
jgi:hypothetical protein